MTLLGSQRDLFDIPDGVTYLNAAYMSPQLRAVTAAGLDSVRRGAHPWEKTVSDFFEPAETARDLFATVVSGDPDGVALIPSVSYGIGLAAANVEIGASRTVVMVAGQFPSNVYPWRAAVEKQGGEIVTVPRSPDRTWTDGLLAAIDGRTAVVAVPNVHWTDGSLLDLVQVAEAARQVGAAVVVDATQSIGAMPFDAAAVQPDFVVAAAYKWMLGPYSIGFTWCAPHRREGTPLEFAWVGREGADDFASLVDYRDEFQAGARRYDMGEKSNFILLPMAIAAMSQIVDWGVANIAETIGVLTARIGDMATERSLVPTPAAQRAPHLSGIRLPDGVPPGLTERLAADRVFVSVRGDSIRVGPHLYNTTEDVDRLFASLDAVR